MKQLILLCILVTSMFTAQTVKMIDTNTPKVRTVGGSTVTVSIPQGQMFNLYIKEPKTKQEVTINSTITTNSAVYKSTPYEVYATKKGRLFIVAPTKDGLGYTRKYINTTHK